MKNLDISSATTRILFPLPEVVAGGEGPAAPVALPPQSLVMPAVESDAGSAFAHSPFSLGILGLRLAGNTGDSEALLLLTNTVANRLAKDNESQKLQSDGISQRVVVNATIALGKMRENYVKLPEIRSDIAELTAERTALVESGTALQTSLEQAQASVEHWQSVVDELMQGPLAVETQLAHARAQLSGATAAVGRLEGEIVNVTAAIDAKDVAISSLKADEASGMQYETAKVALAVMIGQLRVDDAPDNEDLTESTHDELAAAIFDEVERRGEINLDEQVRSEILRDLLVDNEIDRAEALAVGLSAFAYELITVLQQARSADLFQADALTHATTAGDRYQFPV